MFQHYNGWRSTEKSFLNAPLKLNLVYSISIRYLTTNKNDKKFRIKYDLNKQTYVDYFYYLCHSRVLLAWSKRFSFFVQWTPKNKNVKISLIIWSTYFGILGKGNSKPCIKISYLSIIVQLLNSQKVWLI